MSRTLFDRKALAQSRNESLFIGALGFTGEQLVREIHRLDMWQLTIVLGTALLYLYTRSVETVVFWFIGFYFFEYALFWTMSWALSKTSAPLEATHTRTLVMLTDPIVAGLSLLVAYYILDFTAIGQSGIGADVVQSRELQETWRTVLIMLTVLLTGFVRLYWTALFALLSMVWILYGIDAGRAEPIAPYALWLAVRASIFVLFYMLAFVRPFGETFMANVLFSLLAATWFASAIQFAFEQQ